MHKIAPAIAALFALSCSVAFAQTKPAPKPGSPSNAPVRVRGTILKMAGHTLTLSTSSGPVAIQLSPHSHLMAVLPSDATHIKSNTFVGVTSLQMPDGTQRAVEVHVFPESMRGAGEGSYAWDWPGTTGAKAPHSRMTNGTITAMPAGTAHSRMTNGTVKVVGGSLVVAYKGRGGAGMQSIQFPPNIPIVTFGPATPKDVKPGVKAFVIAMRLPNGDLVAQNILVGKDGAQPPM